MTFLVQIISTLRQIQTPDAAQQLFMVLTETSASIETSQQCLNEEAKEAKEAE